MSLIARAFTRPKQEARDITGLNGVPTTWEDAQMRGGGLVTEGGAMALGAFYACVTLLADTIASLSIKAYKMQGATTELVTPQPRLFVDSPYPETTWFSWLWMFMESLAITGNGFGYITAREGEPPYEKASGIMPIHPDCLNIEIPQSHGVEWADPIYSVEGKRVPTEDIVHIKRYPIAGCAYGMSPVEKAASAVGLGLAAEKYGLRWFRDSATPSGLLQSDLDLTPQQVKANQKQWITSHQGRRLPAIMSNGLKWQSVSITPEESQFLETRSFQRSDIAMWFRIPPHMIGDTEKSTSWGTGIEQQSIGFVTYTLRPWLTCIEQALSALLPRGQFAKFNIDGLLRGDVKARWEAYRLGREAGVYSVDEIREKENLPPVPKGDGRLQPMNFVPLGTPPPEKAPASTARTKENHDDSP